MSKTHAASRNSLSGDNPRISSRLRFSALNKTEDDFSIRLAAGTFCPVAVSFNNNQKGTCKSPVDHQPRWVAKPKIPMQSRDLGVQRLCQHANHENPSRGPLTRGPKSGYSLEETKTTRKPSTSLRKSKRSLRVLSERQNDFESLYEPPRKTP